MTRWRQHSERLKWSRYDMPVVGLSAIALMSALLLWQGITVQYPLTQGLLNPRVTWPSFVHFSLLAGLRHAVV